jgi:long-subunit fatty acid transport protein
VQTTFVDGQGILDITLPSQLNVGLSWAWSRDWELWFNWRRDFWSQSQLLTVDYRNSLPNTVVDYAFQDSDSYAVGISGDWDDYTIDVALFYDITPVPSAAERHWSIPDSDRIGFLLGANYHFNSNFKLGAYYEYISFRDTQSTVAGMQALYQDMEYHILSLRIGWEL